MKFRGIFIKFGQEDHLLKLQKGGCVHCRPLQYFTELEDQTKVRGDKYETVIEINNYENMLLEFKLPNEPDSAYKKINLTRAQFLSTRADPFGNLFCLYSLNFFQKNEGEICTIDVKNKQFGSHLLLITDPVEFVERIQKQLEKKKYKADWGFVKYSDFKTHMGKKGIFQKDLMYEYQKEFRIFIHNITNETIELEIGDISDITTLYSTENLHLFKFKVEIQRPTSALTIVEWTL